MCTCGDQSCIHWSSTPWQSECCQEVVTEQWSGQRLEDSKIVICAKIMKVGIILSIVNIPIFTICYLVDLLFRYKQEIYDDFFGTNGENILGQINLTVAVRPTPTLQTCEGQPRRFSVTSESDSSSDSSFSDPEPQSRNPDFPPSYEEAVL